MAICIVLLLEFRASTLGITSVIVYLPLVGRCSPYLFWEWNLITSDSYNGNTLITSPKFTK